MRFLFIHGGWQGGWCWDQVASHLRQAGHETYAPTLRGLEPSDVDRSGITASDMAAGLADDVRRRDLRDVIAVGHSGGGPIMQLLYEALPDRPARLVFVDAWVLMDGQRVYDVLPEPLSASLQAVAAKTPDRTIPMPEDFWRHALLNDVSDEEAGRWLERVVPCPDGWMSEKLKLPTFAGATVPTSYVFLDDDLSAPREVFKSCAGRLRDPRTTTSPGGHEAMLTQPEALAEALLRVCQ
jgi:pimeloyl-ACP methyl ester carboxylesterase